jgi:tripartite ATP-independent transporter DctP family solute receptor
MNGISATGSWRYMASGILVGVGLSILLNNPAIGQTRIEATLASVNSADYINPRMQMLFIEKVKQRTNGGLNIKWIGSGQLGGLKENLEAIVAGNLEMCGVANANLGPLSPGPMLFDLPFVFRDYDHMKKVVRGPIGEQIYKEFEEKTGIKLLMTGLPDGARSIWNRQRPVRTPADVKGLKLRVMQSPLLVDAFALLGAIPAPMSSTEVYMAAKQGVIDGAEWGPLGMIEQKSYETAKYYTLTKHLNSPGSVAVGVKWFNGLPRAYQDAITISAEEARAWFDAQFDKEEAAALEDVRRRGMEIIEAPDLAPFVAAVRPVYDKYAERVGGWKMIQAVLETK